MSQGGAIAASLKGWLGSPSAAPHTAIPDTPPPVTREAWLVDMALGMFTVGERVVGATLGATSV